MSNSRLWLIRVLHVTCIRTAASDYLVYATNHGIYAAHVNPAAASRPFPVAMFTDGVSTFDVNYENKTVIVVSSGRLKEVAFDNNDETTVNISGLSVTRLRRSLSK